MRLFAGTPFGVASAGIYVALLGLAAFGDLRSRRIPNRLVAVLAVLGLTYSSFQGSFSTGLLHGVEGLLVGLACWLPFYALGWLGAGDVKLYAAASAWLGPVRSLEGALIGALAGAALAAVWMLRSRGVRSTIETLGMAAGSPGLLSSPAQNGKGHSTLPYGIALAFGAVCAAWIPGTFF